MAVERKIYTNNVVRMTQAQFDRLQGSNGFTKGRAMRKIGAVPVEIYAEVHALAAAHGEEVTDEHWERFLSMNPQFRSVSRLDTGASGHIVIK